MPFVIFYNLMTQLFEYFKCTDFFNLICSNFLSLIGDKMKNKMHTKTLRKDKIKTENLTYFMSSHKTCILFLLSFVHLFFKDSICVAICCVSTLNSLI